jgi:geranylgeranyl pyrophosphate synthase
LGGHEQEIIEPARLVLVEIGKVSQVIDDITGTFPGILDDDKDSIGEIANLRRTIPLVLLAQQELPTWVRDLLGSKPPLDHSVAIQLREVLWHSQVPALALELCQRSITEIKLRLENLALGRVTHAYLIDLFRHRLIEKIECLQAAVCTK